jgi:cytochrome c556
MKIGFIGRVAAALVVIGASSSLLAVAQTDVAKAVNDRQDAMKQMGALMFGGVNKVVRGEEPPANATDPAAKLDQIAQSLPRLFPSGSGREAVAATRARPEVWSNKAEFDAAAQRFAAETAKLAAAARTGDLDAIKAAFGPAAQACGGCHEARPADGGKFRFPRS